ncbi:MAG: hypothetical protein K6E13_10595 [Lachnospiraceae bacterium]|nr:hypothetical protein [Lachnospiraceae bacterium]
MKTMKRLLPLFTVMLFCLFLFPVGVKADTTIALNKWVTYTNNSDSYVSKQVVFTAPANGYFTVTQKNRYAEGYRHDDDLYVIDRNNVELGYAYNGDGSTCTISATKGHKYYIKSDGIPYNGGTLKLYVTFKESSSWETEENDTAVEADKLTNKKWKYGVLNASGHYDYFKIKLKKTSKVKLTFGPKSVGDDCSFHLTLYNTDNVDESIFSYVSSVSSKTIYLKKGTYYLRVSGTVDLPYKLKYQSSSFSVKKPVIKKVKRGEAYKSWWYGTKMRYFGTISLKTKGTIDGYGVQIAKKSNMKSKISLSDSLKEKDCGTYSYSDTKSTIRRFKSQGFKRRTYYVRVRGYVYTAFDEKIYGSWSKAKRVKL